MIGSLRGRVGGRTGNALLVDVGGVGYVVQCPLAALQTAGEVGDDVFLHVHTQVREDAISLFGFPEPEEKEAFLMLLGVQGVGPKAALSILSVRPAADLLDAIAAGDKGLLTAADGVGPKLAARIISELQAKAVAAGGRGGPLRAVGKPGGQAGQDARDALRGLGYSAAECDAMVAAVLAVPDPPLDVPSILNACLKAAGARAA